MGDPVHFRATSIQRTSRTGGADDLFDEWEDGQNVPVSGANMCRARYNNATGAFELSVNGGAFHPITPWVQVADFPTLLGLTGAAGALYFVRSMGVVFQWDAVSSTWIAENHLFGDGRDGDLAVAAGTVTLVDDMQYRDLSIAGGAVLTCTDGQPQTICVAHTFSGAGELTSGAPSDQYLGGAQVVGAGAGNSGDDNVLASADHRSVLPQVGMTGAAGGGGGDVSGVNAGGAGGNTTGRVASLSYACGKVGGTGGAGGAAMGGNGGNGLGAAVITYTMGWSYWNAPRGYGANGPGGGSGASEAGGSGGTAGDGGLGKMPIDLRIAHTTFTGTLNGAGGDGGAGGNATVGGGEIGRAHV